MKYKPIHIILAVLSLGLAFAGFINTDYADKKFWWTFWDICSYVGIAGFLVFLGSIIINTNRKA